MLVFGNYIGEAVTVDLDIKEYNMFMVVLLYYKHFRNIPTHTRE